MAKGFAINNSMTNHGGIIQATQQRTSQMGNLFLRAGDGHFCPKCKCWSTIQPSHNHIIMDGKPVAYVDDLLSCGAKILPKQDHVVGTSQGDNYRSSQQSNSVIPVNNSFKADEQERIHKIQFQVLDESSQSPIPELLYEIYNKNSGVLLVQGYTDQNGMTALYESEYSPESVELITLNLSNPIEPI